MPTRARSRPPRSLGQVAVDFDGVIMDAQGEPIEGALEAISKLARRSYRIVVFTCRRDLMFVDAWLEDHGFGPYILSSTFEKPRADVYIDDKALRFTDWREAEGFVLAEVRP